MRLFDLVPPPKCPSLRPNSWQAIESRLGVALPTDYKRIVDRYGYGIWGEWIILFVPDAPVPAYDLLIAAPRITVSEAQFLASMPVEERLRDFPYRMYEDGSGLFPFAVTTEMDVLYWNVSFGSVSWPIVVVGSRDTRHSVHHLSLDDLLYRFLTAQLVCNVVPGSKIPCSSRFVAWPNKL